MVNSKDQWKAWLYLSPAIVLLLIFTVWPIINTVRMSLLEGYSGLKAASGASFEFGLGNFVKVIKYRKFLTCLQNTVLGAALVFRVQRHALDHQHLGIFGGGTAQYAHLLFDIGLAPAAQRFLGTGHIDGHGVGAGGFAEHAHPAGPQPGLDQAAHGGFSPRAVYMHHMAQCGAVAGSGAAFQPKPGRPKQSGQHNNGFQHKSPLLFVPDTRPGPVSP